MRRWRVPLLLSALVVLAQLAPLSPLVDATTERAPAGVHLVYPLGHLMLAPLTLLADWLNGGSTADLKGFALWATVIIVVARLWTGGRAVGRSGGQADRRTGGRADGRTGGQTVRWGWWLSPAVAVGGVSAFLVWAIYAPRPIPRLVADVPDALIFDIHSHTRASHDGRDGFTAAANSAWHARAGFDVAFVTDHNTFREAREPRFVGADALSARRLMPARLLGGEELSLFGLHMVVLGNDTLIPNTPANGSWDSTLALLQSLSRPDSAAGPAAFLVASLPEYWRNHWGADLQELVTAGVEGFEIWTSSPRAMDIPASSRRHVVARARLSDLVTFGATDMHGLGYTASVWNVTTLPGWRAMDDTVLADALLAHWRAGGFASNQVIALRRWLPVSRVGQAIAVPVNVLSLPRRATPGHAVALLGWIWVAALLSRRSRARSP